MTTTSALFLSEKIKLERYCAYEDRCVFQIKKKLLTSLLTDKEKASLILSLQSNKFLDDHRFACSYVSGKTRIKKWGEYKIRMGLKAYQINEQTIAIAMKEIQLDDYFKTLKYLIEKKSGQLSAIDNDYEKKIKIIRFLVSKGYSLSDIYQAGINAD